MDKLRLQIRAMDEVRNTTFTSDSGPVKHNNYTVKVNSWAYWPITARAYPSFRSMKQLRVLLLPLEGMLVHPSISSGFPDSLLVPIHTPGQREAL